MRANPAPTVAKYLASLPPDRRKELAGMRKFVRAHLPKGYVERMNWGIITYEIPLSRYSNTYKGQPLCYAGLAARKDGFTLHLMGAYVDPKNGRKLKQAFKDAGKKFDMGKSCLHFKTMDDLALDAVAEIVAAIPPDAYIAFFEKTRPKKK